MLALAFSVFMTLVSAASIVSQKIETSAGEKQFERLLIYRGGAYSIINSPKVTVLGDTLVSGSFYVYNNDSGVAVEMSGQGLNNRGVISLKSVSHDAESSFVLAAKSVFYNEGAMFFGLCNTQIQSTPFEVSSGRYWENRGGLVFEKSEGPIGEVRIHGNAGDPAISNERSICLYNTHWKTTTKVLGQGCINVGPGAFLDYLVVKGIDPERVQTIRLESPDSRLKFSGLNGSYIHPVIKVYGFGRNNFIDIEDESGTLLHDYQEDQGEILFGQSGNIVFAIHIGRSYSGKHIVLTDIPGGKRFSYAGPDPSQEIPDQCSQCRPTCPRKIDFPTS